MKKLSLLFLFYVAGSFFSSCFCQNFIATHDEKRKEAEMKETQISVNSNDNVIDEPQKSLDEWFISQNSVDFKSNSDETLSGLPIIKEGKNYKMGNKIMSKSEYINFIQSNCEEAWKSYRRGRKLWIQGWVLFGVGTPLVVVGVPLAFVAVATHDIVNNTWYNNSNNINITRSVAWYSGVILASCGVALLTASIPCIIVGGIKKYNSHKIYNLECTSKSQARNINFGISANRDGLGLRMIF